MKSLLRQASEGVFPHPSEVDKWSILTGVRNLSRMARERGRMDSTLRNFVLGKPEDVETLNVSSPGGDVELSKIIKEGNYQIDRATGEIIAEESKIKDGARSEYYKRRAAYIMAESDPRYANDKKRTKFFSGQNNDNFQDFMKELGLEFDAKEELKKTPNLGNAYRPELGEGFISEYDTRDNIEQPPSPEVEFTKFITKSEWESMSPEERHIAQRQVRDKEEFYTDYKKQQDRIDQIGLYEYAMENNITLGENVAPDTFGLTVSEIKSAADKKKQYAHNAIDTDNSLSVQQKKEQHQRLNTDPRAFYAEHRVGFTDSSDPNLPGGDPVRQHPMPETKEEWTKNFFAEKVATANSLKRKGQLDLLDRMTPEELDVYLKQPNIDKLPNVGFGRGIIRPTGAGGGKVKGFRSRVIAKSPISEAQAQKNVAKTSDQSDTLTSERKEAGRARENEVEPTKLVQKNEAGEYVVILKSDPPGIHAWVNTYVQGFDQGDAFKWPLSRGEAVQAAKDKTGLHIIVADNVKDHEAATALAAIVRDPAKFKTGVVILGHGEGKGSGWKFWNTDTPLDNMVERVGGKADVIMCNDLYKMNMATAESRVYQSERLRSKAISESYDTTAAQSSPAATETMAQHDMTFLGNLFGGFRVMDLYRGALEGKFRPMLLHQQRYAFVLNEKTNVARKIIADWDGAAGGNTAKTGVISRFFGKEGSKNATVKSDWRKMIKGEIPTPEPMKPAVEAIRGLMGEYHSSIIERNKKGILAAKRRQAKQVDVDPETKQQAWYHDENGNEKPLLNKDGSPKMEADDRILHLINESLTGKLDIDKASNAELLASYERYLTKTKEPRGESYGENDRAEVREVLEDLKAAEEWGQDPELYVHESFTGAYHIHTKDGHAIGSGHVVVSGQTANECRRNLVKAIAEKRTDKDGNLLYNPNGSFIMTTSLHQAVALKGRYKPVENSNEEGTVAAIHEAMQTWGGREQYDIFTKTAEMLDKRIEAFTKTSHPVTGLNILPDTQAKGDKWAAPLFEA